jgi:hypothetical protein
MTCGSRVPISTAHLKPKVAEQLKAALNGKSYRVISPDPAVSSEIDKLWQSAPLKREAQMSEGSTGG